MGYTEGMRFYARVYLSVKLSLVGTDRFIRENLSASHLPVVIVFIESRSYLYAQYSSACPFKSNIQSIEIKK